MPGAPSSFLLLLVRHLLRYYSNSFLLLVAWHLLLLASVLLLVRHLFLVAWHLFQEAVWTPSHQLAFVEIRAVRSGRFNIAPFPTAPITQGGVAVKLSTKCPEIFRKNCSSIQIQWPFHSELRNMNSCSTRATMDCQVFQTFWNGTCWKMLEPQEWSVWQDKWAFQENLGPWGCKQGMSERICQTTAIH